MDNQRIPLKQEYNHYIAARNRFGTWNKAIEAAGFSPNPVLFAHKHLAKDGHKCDSLAEKIIDDWLYTRKIHHQVKVPYPQNKKYKADFVINDKWVEYFGLSGELKSYDKLKKKKLLFAKEHSLNIIAIYPKHLFPKCQLSKILLSRI